MFHLSLPVERFDECLSFYEGTFDASVVALAPGVAYVFAFGAQVTLHDRARSAMTEAARSAMHFGAIVPVEEWTRVRDRVVSRGQTLLECVEPSEGGGGRAKLLIADPSGNLVEINSAAG